jgi:Tol biopolymer transport system component
MTAIVAASTVGFARPATPLPPPGEQIRLTVDLPGGDPNDPVSYPSVSRDGRFVAFQSSADNISTDPPTGNYEVYVKDMDTGDVTRISRRPDGTNFPIGTPDANPHISSDGTLVTFYADLQFWAADLVTGTTEHISVNGSFTSGSPYETAPSADGRYVAFSGLSNVPEFGWVSEIYVRDRIAATTTLVSVRNGQSSAYGANEPDISADGRYVSWYSASDDYVDDKPNDVPDVFVRDRVAGTTVRASIAADGGSADNASWRPSLSDDGMRVVFESYASNLLATPTDGGLYTFVRDLVADTTRMVSNGTSDIDRNSRSEISANGQYVAFKADSPELVYVRDLATNAVWLASEGVGGARPDDASFARGVTDDGTAVFDSWARNLDPADDNQMTDVYRRAPAGPVERVIVGLGGGESGGHSYAPVADSDGRLVAFESAAPDLIEDDANDVTDVFVRDVDAATTVRVSVDPLGEDPNGASHNPSISADGSKVAFWSTASDLVPDDTNGAADVFVRDLATQTTSRVSVAASGGDPDGASHHPSISADGTHVAFVSTASNLVSSIGNGTAAYLYVRDLVSGTTQVASVGAAGPVPVDGRARHAIDRDGSAVAFFTASAAVPEDTNGFTDVFVRDLGAGTTVRASVALGGANPNGNSGGPSLSYNGRRVAFSSAATNLVTDAGPPSGDVYVRDLDSGQTTLISQSTAGEPANYGSLAPAISGDGTRVVFWTLATNLDPSDGFGTDIYMRNLTAGTTSLISFGSWINSTGATISGDGHVVVYRSLSPTIGHVHYDSNGFSDIYLAVVG